MNKYVTYIFLGVMFLTSCISSELVENWKNPDINTFEVNKVLVVGMTSDTEGRKIFEKKLVNTLKKNGVIGERSLDFFEKSFTSSPKTEEDLKVIEGELIKAGFDAILLSKVLAVEDKMTVVQAYRNFDKNFKSFRDDYYESQDIYHNDDYYEVFEVYHAETSLYCICPDKERELIWKGSIDITDPENIRKAVGDYVKVLIWALKGQKLLIIDQELTHEDFDI
ncbi:hypothetical protein [Aquimarina sp. RZ0]|uniref:hypothetical protein n=1 Tax=Aquimarina sp. RZ0 TaxID=2607730 RepID=UPI0011F27331|nr:hypothetical protein [Aquimarina sp. RZ0]KAA1242724.1 hypothetical protein F0000_24340 [Aquimarina sp. RZ0]